jgi:hypothetical protein
VNSNYLSFVAKYMYFLNVELLYCIGIFVMHLYLELLPIQLYSRPKFYILISAWTPYILYFWHPEIFMTTACSHKFSKLSYQSSVQVDCMSRGWTPCSWLWPLIIAVSTPGPRRVDLPPHASYIMFLYIYDACCMFTWQIDWQFAHCIEVCIHLSEDGHHWGSIK